MIVWEWNPWSTMWRWMDETRRSGLLVREGVPCWADASELGLFVTLLEREVPVGGIAYWVVHFVMCLGTREQ